MMKSQIKKYVDDLIQEGTIVRYNQTRQNYLKVSAENDIYDLTKYDKIQITDTIIIKYPNTGGYLLQNWVIKSNDENNVVKIQKFIKSTKKALQQAIAEQHPYHQPVKVLCILRQVLIIIAQMFLGVSNELILYKVLI